MKRARQVLGGPVRLLTPDEVADRITCGGEVYIDPELAEVFPPHLASDEAYLAYLLTTPEDELPGADRQLIRDIRAHHPDIGPVGRS